MGWRFARMKPHVCGISIVLAFAAAFAATWPFRGEWAHEIANASLNRPLTRVTSWHIQLLDLDVAQLRGDPADMLVLDPAGRSTPLTAADVAALKTKPDGRRRIVLAYLSLTSIDRRSRIWQQSWQTDPPGWLGGADCARPKTRLVRYWQPDWHDMLYRSADSIMTSAVAAGFDGVYLAGLDGYHRYERARASARGDMIDLVVAFSRSARQVRPGFLVVAENGADLLTDAGYRLALDAAAEEEVLTGRHETGGRNGVLEIAATYDRLGHLQREGKPVFAVEYFLNSSAIAAAARELHRHGLVPAFETRARDGRDPTLPVDAEKQIGTPEYTRNACPAGALG